MSRFLTSGVLAARQRLSLASFLDILFTDRHGLFQDADCTIPAESGDEILGWRDQVSGIELTDAGVNPAQFLGDEGLDFNSSRLQNTVMPAGWASGSLFLLVKSDSDGGLPNGDPCYWSTGGQGHYPYSDDVIYHGFASTSRPTIADPAPSLSLWRLFEVTSEDGYFAAWLDGELLFETDTNTVGFSSFMRIGGFNNDLPFSGRIKLVGIRQATPTTEERASIRSLILAQRPD